MTLVLLVALPCLVALLLRRRAPREWRALDAWYTPAVVGLIWAVFPFVAWGGLNPIPSDHDELAYLLQAQIFATGRWAAAAPPSPDLFAQPHVLVTPVLASKYPPGHSLLLALGALAGAPAIIVFLLNALRVGMVFTLARRLSDAPTALLTVGLLYVGNDQIRFSSSYYSQLTAGAFLVTAWYCLCRWHDNHRRRWLLGVAFLLGWIAVTRPWSAVAFALPIGFVVVREASRHRRWRDLGFALALGSCVVALIPLWSWKTLGDWRRIPLAVYTRDYMPFDFPHFGVVSAAPRLTLPPELAAANATLLEVERRHTLANLGADAVSRARSLWKMVWHRLWLFFAAVTVIGLAVLPTAAWLSVITLLATFAMYLAHPTWNDWTVYYFEVTPVLTFLAALGFTTVLRGLAGETVQRTVRLPAPRAAMATLFACVLLLPVVVTHAAVMRRWVDRETAGRRRFERHLMHLPRTPAIVFVRYGPNHNRHRTLIANRADWPTSPVWVVHAMQAAGERLLALTPDRQGYLYDEEGDRFFMIPRQAPSGGVDGRPDGSPAPP